MLLPSINSNDDLSDEDAVDEVNPSLSVESPSGIITYIISYGRVALHQVIYSC